MVVRTAFEARHEAHIYIRWPRPLCSMLKALHECKSTVDQ